MRDGDGRYKSGGYLVPWPCQNPGLVMYARMREHRQPYNLGIASGLKGRMRYQ